MDISRINYRQDEIRNRLAQIAADPYTTEESDGPERDELIAEYGLLRRRGELAIIERNAADPRNTESGYAGRPAIIHGRGLAETPAQVVQRMGNPWRDDDTTAAGLIARAQTAVEGLAPADP